MKTTLLIILALIAFGVISTAHAGDIAAGKEKVLFVCSECHGMTGISDIENFPNLARRRKCISPISSRRLSPASAMMKK